MIWYFRRSLEKRGEGRKTKVYPQTPPWKYLDMTEIDFIKARLEYFKLLLTSSIGAVFLLFLYQVQNPERITGNIQFGYVVAIIVFSSITLLYWVWSEKLKAVD